jgi:RNA polymerase sigma-70 factor (ECF subfamily)
MGPSKQGHGHVHKSDASQRLAASQNTARNAQWEDFVRRCGAGEQAALSSLYDQAAHLVYSVVLKVLANQADAEEVTLDVFTQIWRTAQSYQASKGSVTAWLVMLARSRAIDRMRSRATRQRREEPIFEYADFPSASSGPEQSTAEAQRRRRILAAMAGLPPDQRQAVELAFFSGLSHSELAERLQLPLVTVKTRLRSSMLKLRESLAEIA